MKFGKSMSGLVTAATTILTATPAYTQESFPNKPIRIIVGYAAGGGNDVIARVVAEKMSKGLGQPVLVENKPGAHSIIAAQYVAAAKSDGYTLFMGPNGPLTINPAIYSKLPYSPTRDFVPVALIGTYPLILVVSSSHSAKSVPELVKYAKDSPGKANYAASAATFQLASELFNQKTNTQFQHIGYKGTNESIAAVIAGDVTMTLADPPTEAGLIKSGKVRTLALTYPNRHPSWPELPTMAEAGLPEIELNIFAGFLAPAGTPAPIVKKLQDEVARVVHMPEVRERFSALGIDPVGGTSDEFKALIASDIKTWTEVATAANIKAD